MHKPNELINVFLTPALFLLCVDSQSVSRIGLGCIMGFYTLGTASCLSLCTSLLLCWQLRQSAMYSHPTIWSGVRGSTSGSIHKRMREPTSVSQQKLLGDCHQLSNILGCCEEETDVGPQIKNDLGPWVDVLHNRSTLWRRRSCFQK